MEIQAVKRLKTFHINEDGQIVPLSSFTEEEEQMSSLDKFKSFNGNAESSEVIHESEVKRTEVIQNLAKSMSELNQALNLISMIRKQEYFNVKKCVRPISTHRQPILPTSQRLSTYRSFFKSARDILKKGIDASIVVARSRKKFVDDCLILRRRWRLILSSANYGASSSLISNIGKITNISYKDSVIVDASFMGAGEVFGISDGLGLVRLVMGDSGLQLAPEEIIISQLSLELSLSKSCGTIVSKCNSSELFRTCSTYIESISSIEQIEHHCHRRRHDVLCRSIFAQLKAEAAHSSDLTTSIAKGSESRYPRSEVLHVVSVERGRVSIVAGPDLFLNIRLVPQRSYTPHGTSTAPSSNDSSEPANNGDGDLFLSEIMLRLIQSALDQRTRRHSAQNDSQTTSLANKETGILNANIDLSVWKPRSNIFSSSMTGFSAGKRSGGAGLTQSASRRTPPSLLRTLFGTVAHRRRWESVSGVLRTSEHLSAALAVPMKVRYKRSVPSGYLENITVPIVDTIFSTATCEVIIGDRLLTVSSVVGGFDVTEAYNSKCTKEASDAGCFCTNCCGHTEGRGVHPLGDVLRLRAVSVHVVTVVLHRKLSSCAFSLLMIGLHEALSNLGVDLDLGLAVEQRTETSYHMLFFNTVLLSFHIEEGVSNALISSMGSDTGALPWLAMAVELEVLRDVFADNTRKGYVDAIAADSTALVAAPGAPLYRLCLSGDRRKAVVDVLSSCLVDVILDKFQ